MLTGLLPLRAYRDQTLAYTALRLMKLPLPHPSRILYDTCASMRQPRIAKRQLLPHAVKSMHINGELLQHTTQKVAIKKHHRTVTASSILTDTTGSSIRQVYISSNLHSTSPGHACSTFSKHDDRETASVRAKFALDRAYLPTQRIRLYQHQLSPLCTHQPCHAQNLRMTREHVLLQCQRFQHTRNNMLASLSHVHPSLSLHTPPLALLLGILHSPIVRKHAHELAALTGTFIRDVYQNIAEEL
jgi:hypothetical protein